MTRTPTWISVSLVRVFLITFDETAAALGQPVREVVVAFEHRLQDQVVVGGVVEAVALGKGPLDAADGDLAYAELIFLALEGERKRSGQHQGDQFGLAMGVGLLEQVA